MQDPSAKFDVCIKDTKILISSECEDQANSWLGILSSNIDWCKFYKIASERFFCSWPLSRISWQIATSYFDKLASSTKTMIDQYLLKSRCIKPSSTLGIRTRKKWVTNQEIWIYIYIYTRHWWSGDQKEYKIYRESCWDTSLWNNRYSQICRKIQGKIRMNESHTRWKRPPLITSSLASSPSLMSPTKQSAHHRSQRREDHRDEHARRLDPLHRLCIGGAVRPELMHVDHGGWRVWAAPRSRQ